MITNFLMFLMVAILNIQDSPLQQMRELYLKAENSETAANQLMSLTEKKADEKAIFEGYRAAADMLMAKHAGNPFSKMSHFKKGKKRLVTAIQKDSQNVELRFIRFAVQAEAPSFLGYNEHLEEDKQLVLAGLKTTPDAYLKKMMLDYLKVSKGLSAEEKKRL